MYFVLKVNTYFSRGLMGKRIHDYDFIELQQHSTTVNQTRTMYFFFMIAIAINVKINHNLIHATVNGHFH